MMNSDSNFDETSSSDDDERTETHDAYELIMKDPNFLLTMQPRMFEEVEGEDEDEVEEEEQKMDYSLMESNLSETQRSLMQE